MRVPAKNFSFNFFKHFVVVEQASSLFGETLNYSTNQQVPVPQEQDSPHCYYFVWLPNEDCHLARLTGAPEIARSF